MSDILSDLKKRGLIYQNTPGVEKAFEKGTTIYLGIDPTGESLHIGSLLGIVVLKRLVEAGNRIVVLAGGGTALIGDPGGKDAERPILPKETIESNKEKLKKQLGTFFVFDTEKVVMADNAEWLEKLTLIDFLRDTGKHISVNTMMDKESVKARLDREEGISYAEFSYQLLQAYDFLELHRRHSCEVQIGGSDQWGNIVQGVELIRKKLGKQAYALSFPLIVNPKTGKKFGKTEAGTAIWLDAEKTHPFHFYQFLVNVDDEMAPQLLKFFSFKSIDEINKLIAEWEKQKETRSLQRELAYEVTAMVHGDEAARNAREITDILFGKDQEKITKQNLEFVKKALPYTTITTENEFSLEDSLVSLGLASSKGEARRLLDQKGATSTKLFDSYFLVRKGRRDYGIVEIKNE